LKNILNNSEKLLMQSLGSKNLADIMQNAENDTPGEG